MAIVEARPTSVTVPGPPGPTLLHTAALFGRPQQFLMWCRDRYGPTFRIRLASMGTIVYVSEPDDVRAVFRADPEQARAGEANSVLGPILGERSVLTSDGTDHRWLRRMLAPPFHGDAVAALTGPMAEVTREHLARWPVGRPFAVHDDMRLITLEVILRTVLGVRRESRRAELRRVLPPLVDVGPVTVLALAYPSLRAFWPWSRLNRVAATADRVLHEEIRAAREDPDLAERSDALGVMVRARDEQGRGLSDDELRDQLVTLLLAGHETTATGLSWTLERLVRHPEVLREATTAARTGGPEGDRYLAAVVTESLRARPVVFDVVRQLHAPLSLPSVELPAGVMVAPAIAVIHRSDRHHDAADTFRPDRFTGARPDPATWLPFGGGTRRCLGAAFATTEMRVVLGEILRAVDLAPSDEPGEAPRARHVTLVPARGARITVARRTTTGS